MTQWKLFINLKKWGFVYKHLGLLGFAWVASLLFYHLGFITHHQVPLTMLLSFFSLEWVQLSQSRASNEQT
ncbi:hypothetical protein [Alteromonas sp. 14N.309.X.WAT.G.H12]|uniref:hypothetical protein n=1 Tax=Alteromonas sp. 14N.309.X.WAT.G.H12 TaxID=3120824 RepID=UPI002FCED4ED